jgi:hypothetical protein
MTSSLTFQLLSSADLPLRRGLLAVAGKTPVATPNCLLNTIRGAVPHLTPDMLTYTETQVLQVAIDHFADHTPSVLETSQMRLDKLLNVKVSKSCVYIYYLCLIVDVRII